MSDFDWIDTTGNKIYSATFESYPNNCYVTSVIVMADSAEEAHNKIQVWRQGDSKYDVGKTKYTSNLKQIEFDTNGISRVGHGSNPRY